MTELSEAEARLIERAAQTIVARELAVPAILFLESVKPLAFLGGQALRFFEPMVRIVVERDEYRIAADLLEDRDKVERLIRRIEDLRAERDAGRRRIAT